jgi:hypothetical protein
MADFTKTPISIAELIEHRDASNDGSVYPAPTCELCRHRPVAIDRRCESCWLTLARFDCGVVSQAALQLDARRRSLAGPAAP